MKSFRGEINNRLRKAAQAASEAYHGTQTDDRAPTPSPRYQAGVAGDIEVDATGFITLGANPITQPHARVSSRALTEPSRREEWRRWARAILAADDAWMIVDTETTGVEREADIIEFAAVTPSGRMLADCLIRPSHPIPPFITELTGITNTMVANAPRFPFAYMDTLRLHLVTRGILAYNAPFDIRMLRQNIQRHCRLAWEPVQSACVMRAYGKWRGERYPAGHGWAGRVMVHKLGVACAHLGIPHDRAHRALDDCLVTARVLQAMAAG